MDNEEGKRDAGKQNDQTTCRNLIGALTPVTIQPNDKPRKEEAQ